MPFCPEVLDGIDSETGTKALAGQAALIERGALVGKEGSTRWKGKKSQWSRSCRNACNEQAVGHGDFPCLACRLISGKTMADEREGGLRPRLDRN